MKKIIAYLLMMLLCTNSFIIKTNASDLDFTVYFEEITKSFIVTGEELKGVTRVALMVQDPENKTVFMDAENNIEDISTLM